MYQCVVGYRVHASSLRLPPKENRLVGRKEATRLPCVCWRFLLHISGKLMFLKFQILRIMSGKYRQQSERLNAYSVDPDLVDLKESVQTPGQSTPGREWRVMGPV